MTSMGTTHSSTAAMSAGRAFRGQSATGFGVGSGIAGVCTGPSIRDRKRKSSPKRRGGAVDSLEELIVDSGCLIEGEGLGALPICARNCGSEANMRMCATGPFTHKLHRKWRNRRDLRDQPRSTTGALPVVLPGRCRLAPVRARKGRGKEECRIRRKKRQPSSQVPHNQRLTRQTREEYRGTARARPWRPPRYSGRSSAVAPPVCVWYTPWYTPCVTSNKVHSPIWYLGFGRRLQFDGRAF